MPTAPTPPTRSRVWSATAAAVVLAGAIMTGCSDEGNAPGGSTPPGTLADQDAIDQPPGSGNDVQDGSGEGGNRSGDEDEAPGTGTP